MLAERSNGQFHQRAAGIANSALLQTHKLKACFYKSSGDHIVGSLNLSTSEKRDPKCKLKERRVAVSQTSTPKRDTKPYIPDSCPGMLLLVLVVAVEAIVVVA